MQVVTSPQVDPDDVEFNGTMLDFGFKGRYLVPPGRLRTAGRGRGLRAGAACRSRSAARSEQRVVVALERLPGFVAFDTGGVAATLAVDGAARGKLPGEYELAAGTRELLIQAPHYAEQRIRFEVAGGGERQDLAVKLEPLFARSP